MVGHRPDAATPEDFQGGDPPKYPCLRTGRAFLEKLYKLVLNKVVDFHSFSESPLQLFEVLDVLRRVVVLAAAFQFEFQHSADGPYVDVRA